jgi:hypothetical protein
MLRPVRRGVKVIAGCGFRKVRGTIMRRAVLRVSCRAVAPVQRRLVECQSLNPGWNHEWRNEW